MEVPANLCQDSHEDFPDPVLAAVFALVGISLGQFYNGCPVRGLCWGAGGIAVFLLVNGDLLIAPAGFFFLLACALDAYSTAQEISRGTGPFPGTSRFFWIELVLALSFGTALSIFGIVNILCSAGTCL